MGEDLRCSTRRFHKPMKRCRRNGAGETSQWPSSLADVRDGSARAHIGTVPDSSIAYKRFAMTLQNHCMSAQAIDVRNGTPLLAGQPVRGTNRSRLICPFMD